MFRRLWRDGQASVGSTEMIMIMTIMTIGVLVGMKSFRDSTVTEFADLAQALANLDQSYSVSALAIPWGGSTLTTASSWFEDQLDFCDAASVVNPTVVERCINLGSMDSGQDHGS